MTPSKTLQLPVVTLAALVLAGCGACAGARRDSAQATQTQTEPDIAAMEAPATPPPAPVSDEERDRAFEESQRK